MHIGVCVCVCTCRRVYTDLRIHKCESSINGNNIYIFISKTVLCTKLELINIYGKEGRAMDGGERGKVKKRKKIRFLTVINPDRCFPLLPQ